MADTFLIAPINEGIRSDIKPWLIPDDAFEKLRNAYIFRGRIKKRVGAANVGSAFNTLESRLRVLVGVTDINGDINFVGSPLPGVIFKVGQMFSIGTDTFTVVTPGLAPMITTSVATLYGFDTATGNYTIQGADPNTNCYFYPSEPVMGFHNYEQAAINDEDTYAFDTQFAYRLTATGWVRASTGADTWTGSDADFFWSTTWKGATEYGYVMFTTNFTDTIRYWNGATWTAFTPQYGPNVNETIRAAKIVIPFKNRLLFFNTIENDNAGVPHAFPNRMRYSSDSLALNVLNANAYREDLVPGGGFRDAPTREAIMSAAIFKGRLIVYCERSTYELIYIGSDQKPFVWREINSTLGCESTFSTVSFDTAILGIGATGIHACNGSSVDRIDVKIPDEIFSLRNYDDGPDRIHGVIDYYNEMIYWTVPYSDSLYKYPNRIIAFNYKNNTWAYFDDSITAFGYYQLQASIKWNSIVHRWETTDETWESATLGSKFRYVIAGNQQGYTFIMHDDFAFNAFSLQITDIQQIGAEVVVTAIDHNLNSGDWIAVYNAEGITELNNLTFQIEYIDADTFSLVDAPAITGIYTGSGEMIRINRVEIYTKRFNFYVQQCLTSSILCTDFLVDNVDDGELTVDYLVSSSGVSMREAGIQTGAIMGSSILEMSPYSTLEDSQERFWHTVYLQAQGESIQLKLFFDDEQMKDGAITFLPFQIHGICIEALPTQRL